MKFFTKKYWELVILKSPVFFRSTSFIFFIIFLSFLQSLLVSKDGSNFDQANRNNTFWSRSNILHRSVGIHILTWDTLFFGQGNQLASHGVMLLNCGQKVVITRTHDAGGLLQNALQWKLIGLKNCTHHTLLFLPDWTSEKWALSSFVFKSFFEFLWGILEGRTNRAQPSQLFLKMCLSGTF